MTDREKLIELMNAEPCPSPVICDPECKYADLQDCYAERMADYFIANGVTVQKWIPVTEGLPEQPHKWDARGWYLVALKNGVVKELCYEFLDSSVFGYGWRETAYPVTHWMPLPEPPKEG